MPLWDPNNALSAEAPALVAAGVLVSKCAGFQRFVGASTETAAIQHVVTGPYENLRTPAGKRITLDELVELGGFAQLMPADEEAHVVIEDDAVASCPDEGGNFDIWFRRPVADAELAADGRNGVYLFALDCISAIEYELVELSFTENDPRIQSVRRTDDPMFSHVDEEGAEGEFITATLRLTWGFADEG